MEKPVKIIPDNVVGPVMVLVMCSFYLLLPVALLAYGIAYLFGWRLASRQETA